MISNIGTFILRKGDELAASSLGDTHGYGLYNVGSDLGQLPVAEVGPAMLRALMPVLSSIQEDIDRTRRAVTKTVAAINTVIWPIGMGVAAIAHQFTVLILGLHWEEAAQYVEAFAVVSILQTVLMPLRTILIVHGHTRPQSYAVWMEFVVFVVASLLMVPHFALLGLAYARAIGCVANMLATTATASKYCGQPMLETIACVIRPMVGSIIMAVIVHAALGVVVQPVFQLAIGVPLGVMVFVVWSLVSWRLVGCPEGLESTVLDFLRERRQLRTKRLVRTKE